MSPQSLTEKELREACDYVSSGHLIWKKAGKKRIVGKIVGSLGSHGYYETCINRKRYLVHRLIWLYHYGILPSEQIDHINHDRTDNRIENLRDVTNGQNNYNQSKRSKKTTSRYKGVSWDSKRSCWKSAIQCAGKYTFIGYFDTENIAALAYNNKATLLYKEHANLNKVPHEQA